MEREGQPRPAVELEPFLPPAAPPSTGSLFAAGAAFGILVAAIAAQIWLAYNLEGMARWSFEGAELRTLSALALSAPWRWGVPVVSTAGLAALALWRVRRPLPYAVLAAAAVLALVLTYLWAMAPLTELSDGIRAD